MADPRPAPKPKPDANRVPDGDEKPAKEKRNKKKDSVY